MNFAYWSSYVFTDSSTRAWIVTDFGCLGGALMIAMLSLCSSFTVLSYILSYKSVAAPRSSRPKHGLRFLSSLRRECPPKPEGTGPRVCGAVGSLPPILVFWPRPHSCLGLMHLVISPSVYPLLRRKLTRTILRTFPPGCSSLRLPCLGLVSASGSLQISQSVRPPVRFRRSLCVVVPD